jgi:AhpD family alkylhydroperoxidase
MTRRIAYAQVAPDGIKALSATAPYLEACGIDARLRALVELRTSQINGCAYCVDLHSRQARKAGETQQRLDCLPVWRETTFYNDREQAALAWAETITLVHETRVPDDVYEQAHAQFSDKELVDMTLIISMMNAWNRIAISFRQGPSLHSQA